VLRPGSPFALQVEITSSCNLKCVMCPLTTGGTASHLQAGHTTDLVWSEVLRLARRAKQVFVSGFGEPLMNPRCLPMLAELDASGVKTTLITNGLGITPDVARFLSDLQHLVHINVSIDSPDPAVYRQIRGGSLNRALRRLRNLMDAIDNPSRVSVSSVAVVSSFASLTGFPPVLAGLGVTNYIVQGVIDYNSYGRQQQMSVLSEFQDARHRLESSCADYGIELVWTAPERFDPQANDAGWARAVLPAAGSGASPTRQCMLPWELPYVDKDGRVYSCCFAASTGEVPLGDVTTETLEDVWIGQPYRRFRQNLLNGSTTPSVCRSCDIVPLGEHPLTLYAATLVDAGPRVGPGGLVGVDVRNDGTRTWTAADDVRIGTAGPRDGPSALSHPQWLSPNRTGTFIETAVGPGSTATFVFPTRASAETVEQEFEIVVEQVAWLPNTGFRIRGIALTT
jgi:radical SAM protein with 4Fe4S-binding SPASM domain